MISITFSSNLVYNVDNVSLNSAYWYLLRKVSYQHMDFYLLCLCVPDLLQALPLVTEKQYVSAVHSRLVEGQAWKLPGLQAVVRLAWALSLRALSQLPQGSGTVMLHSNYRSHCDSSHYCHMTIIGYVLQRKAQDSVFTYHRMNQTWVYFTKQVKFNKKTRKELRDTFLLDNGLYNIDNGLSELHYGDIA